MWRTKLVPLEPIHKILGTEGIGDSHTQSKVLDTMHLRGVSRSSTLAADVVFEVARLESVRGVEAAKAFAWTILGWGVVAAPSFRSFVSAWLCALWRRKTATSQSVSLVSQLIRRCSLRSESWSRDSGSLRNGVSNRGAGSTFARTVIPSLRYYGDIITVNTGLHRFNTCTAIIFLDITRILYAIRKEMI